MPVAKANPLVFTLEKENNFGQTARHPVGAFDSKLGADVTHIKDLLRGEMMSNILDFG